MNLFLFLFSIFISVAGYAEREPLRVALFDKPPFAYKEDGVMKGFHYSVAQGIADRTGQKVQLSLVPVRRAVELLRQGQVDILFMTNQTAFEEMKTKKIFLLSANTFIFTKADHKPVLSKKDITGNVARIAGGCTE
ncbi:MAG: transporter substrate-binding domain-containing protein, partial [Pseudobdellovibrionaceae bacterium]